jgi:metallo-beta-lactamase family protein
MKISFHGAARQVTGSKHLLTLKNGKNILLDCGLFQGRRRISEPLNKHWGFDPSSIDAVILSHAHIDHSGLIPKLVKEGFKGKIYCTPATFDLCSIMLPDSGFIQEMDAQYENKRRIKEGKKIIEPLYTSDEAYESLKSFEKVNFDIPTRIFDDLVFTFIENGHLLGSGCVYMEIKEDQQVKRITYTGDIGRVKPQMLRVPKEFPPSDFIICESTYGDRIHDEDEYTLNDFIEIIRETCVENKGKLIIPAFSVGRTQEIIFALDYLYNERKLPPIKVFIDSPLSTKSTFIYKNHLELFNERMQEYLKKDPDPFSFPMLHFIEDANESKRLNDLREPCIIISASGMLEAGRIRHHVANNINNPINTLLIVGYCEPSTLGGKLIAGYKKIKIFGRELEVKARIEYIQSYSGHGDYKEMIHYLSCQQAENVKNIYLVHGDYKAQLEFKTKLRHVGYKNIVIPDLGDSIEI